MKHTLLAQTLDFRSEAAVQAVPYAKSTVGAAVGDVVSAIMAIAVLLVFAFLVMGAFDWIVSGGEKGKVESARNKMTGAVVGLVVLASVFAIMFAVQNFLGIRIFRFGSTGTGTSITPGISPAGGSPGRVGP